MPNSTIIGQIEKALADCESAHDDDEICAGLGITFGMLRALHGSAAACQTCENRGEVAVPLDSNPDGLGCAKNLHATTPKAHRADHSQSAGPTSAASQVVTPCGTMAMDRAYATAKGIRTKQDVDDVARQFATVHGEKRGRSILSSLGISRADHRSEGELHEAIARLLWNRSFREDHVCSWDVAKTAKEWSAVYRTVSEAYLCASAILDMVSGRATRQVP